MSVYPNVPQVSGVPPLPRDPFAQVVPIVLLVADVIHQLGVFFGTSWGIFKDGIPVLLPDTVATFDFRQQWNVSDFPQEQGAFQSYDKVATPYETRIRMATGGSVADKQGFLAQLDAIAGDTNLYDVVTPERTYIGANITHFDYHRAANSGAGLLVVDVWLLEIRVTATASFTNGNGAAGAGSFLGASHVQQPSGASPVNGGQVTPTAPTTAQLRAPLLAN